MLLGSAKVTGEKFGPGQKPQFLPPTTDPACDLGASYPVSENKFSRKDFTPQQGVIAENDYKCQALGIARWQLELCAAYADFSVVHGSITDYPAQHHSLPITLLARDYHWVLRRDLYHLNYDESLPTLTKIKMRE